MFKIHANVCPCPPYARGMIFYQKDKKVWVVEHCQPLSGKLQLGCYRIPDNRVEKDYNAIVEQDGEEGEVI